MVNGGPHLIEARAGADRIFIVVKFETKPGWPERWPELVAP